jgi:hypothetical protein
MRLPRVRFTIRQMMILIAISAFLIPITIKLVYMFSFMYNYPFSASVVRMKNSPRELRTGKSIRLGQTVPVNYEYEVSFDEIVPSGLPYKVILEVQLIDSKTRVVEEAHRMTRCVLAGKGMTQGDFSCELKPTHAGEYRVRYEGLGSDLLGRKSKAPAIGTQYVEVEQ